MTTQPPRPKNSFKSSDPSFTSYDAGLVLDETENKDIKFDHTYWGLASVGSTSREILRMGKANCTFHIPEDADWTDNKVATSFSCLPTLKMTGPNGKEMIISEAMVIDIYLAERFGLLGENKYESLVIQSIYSSIHFLRERTFSGVAWAKEEYRAEKRNNFLKGTLKTFLEDHDFHLRDNGSNGHYVGDKLSLADLHLSNIIHFFGTMPWGKMAVDAFKSYEAVWKVKEMVDKVPEVAAWRATKEFKEYEANSIEWYKDCAVSEDKAHEE
ncbi:Glutathione S-transferase S1 [Entomortierella beljakovae]|nr:Glutathione S-transferase S1 [Entomortierella beljakovae]